MEPKKFNIVFAPSAQRDLERFETATALQLERDIKSYLEIFPLGFRKNRIKKLTGFVPPFYRLRSGDFREYYRIIAHKVIILAITHKKDSERLLKTLE